MSFFPLTFADYLRLKPFFTNQRHRLCAYALPSVLAWATHVYQPHGKIKGDRLLISCEFVNNPDNRHLLLPLLPNGATLDPEALSQIAATEGFRRYRLVPRDYLETWGLQAVEAFFTVTPQPDYDDYIYRTEDLAELKGNRYAKKRNLIHQFERDYQSNGRVAVAPIDAARIEACLDFLERWCAQRRCDANPAEDLACEKQACINTLTHIGDIDVRGLLVQVDGTVCAFAIAAALTADMGTLQFEKAASDIKGLYQFLDNQCARRLFDGFSYINKESDMGIAGLAKAKQSYYPVMKVKSYTLELR